LLEGGLVEPGPVLATQGLWLHVGAWSAVVRFSRHCSAIRRPKGRNYTCNPLILAVWADPSYAGIA